MRLIVLLISLVILAGCAQAIKDYQTGQSTPLAVNEVSPTQEAASIGSTVSSLPIPFAAPLGVAVTFLGGIFLTWKRGVAIRNNNNLVPSTTVSSSNVFSGLIQDAANIFSGMFTTASTTAPTTTGSIIQRVWKTALVTVGAGITTALTIPAVSTFLTGHPVVDTIFVALSSGIAGLEKGLSSVQPIATPVATTTATV